MTDETAIAVKTETVACAGGGGPLGHPKVYLPVPPAGEAVCPYCSRRFVLAADAAPASAHCSTAPRRPCATSS